MSSQVRIVVEGPQGSGKSKIAAALRAEIKRVRRALRESGERRLKGLRVYERTTS